MSGQSGSAVSNSLDGIALKGEVADKQLAEGWFILHHKDVGHGVSFKEQWLYHE
jgi:hypothetical protein